MSSHCLSADIRSRIHSLEVRKNNLLSIEESTWRLKIKVIWMSEGDRNTKLFHRYANHHHNINSIWKINDANKPILQSQQGISNVVVQYFQNAYGNNENITVEDLIWGTDPYLIMYDAEKNDEFLRKSLKMSYWAFSNHLRVRKALVLVDGRLNISSTFLSSSKEIY